MPLQGRATRPGREYTSLCATLGASPVFCGDGVDIGELLARAIERDDEAALDCETDDERTSDLCESREASPGPMVPRPAGGCSSTAPSVLNAYAAGSGPQRGRSLSVQDACDGQPGQKRGRSPSPVPPPKKSKHARKHKKMRYARAEQRERDGHAPRAKVIKRNVEAGASIKTALDSEKLPVAHGAYVAKNSSEVGAAKTYLPADLDRMGFTGIPWDGLTTLLILDAQDRVVGACVGPPDATDWPSVHRRAFEKLSTEGARAHFTKNERIHRRGRFPAINVGISMGTGPSHPGNLDLGGHAEMVRRLLADRDITRMANHASASFNSYAPKVARYYKTKLDALLGKKKGLKKPFPRSTYPTAAFNLGPSVRTFKHRDPLNCPFGLCAIQALGSFDHAKGGHLILWDLGIYIQFPPGSLILIPSATLAHSNTPVEKHESRASFTQYCGGGLFRYVDNGCMTESALKTTDPAKYAQMQEEKAGRWRFGLSCFSTLDELVPKEHGLSE